MRPIMSLGTQITRKSDMISDVLLYGYFQLHSEEIYGSAHKALIILDDHYIKIYPTLFMDDGNLSNSEMHVWNFELEQNIAKESNFSEYQSISNILDADIFPCDMDMDVKMSVASDEDLSRFRINFIPKRGHVLPYLHTAGMGMLHLGLD